MNHFTNFLTDHGVPAHIDNSFSKLSFTKTNGDQLVFSYDDDGEPFYVLQLLHTNTATSDRVVDYYEDSRYISPDDFLTEMRSLLRPSAFEMRLREDGGLSFAMKGGKGKVYDVVALDLNGAYALYVPPLNDPYS